MKIEMFQNARKNILARNLAHSKLAGKLLSPDGVIGRLVCDENEIAVKCVKFNNFCEKNETTTLQHA